MNRAAVVGFAFLVAGVAAAAVLGTEREIGVALALALVLPVVAYTLRPVFSVAANGLAVALLLFVAAVTSGWALIPVLEALEPGEPVARGDLKEVGDTMALPSDAHGSVRVLIHSRMPAEPSALHVALQAGPSQLEAKLESTVTSMRLGRRGHGSVLVKHESEYIDTALASDVSTLKLQTVAGPHSGAIHIEVFREWVPDWALFVGAALLLLGVSALGTLAGAGLHTSVGIAGVLAFGLMAHRTVTPDAAVRPEIGAVVVAMIIAALTGPLANVLVERAMRSRSRAAAQAA